MPTASASATVEAICDEAAAATGIDDFGDDWFLVPLSAWAEDLERPNLTEFGRQFLRRLAVRDVARRLRVFATLRENPEIERVTVPPILYITGLERSGTTLLHNLLALHPGGRALLRWELMEPVPPPEAATYGTDARIAQVQASVDRMRGSALERMHWVNADEPEECVWGYLDAVSMLGQSPATCMPAWHSVLSDGNFTVVFEHYRKLVQLLLWKNPMEPSGFLVLKAPQIGGHIASLAAAFPEARFVITDRDPFRCVTSTAVLGAAIVDPFCVENAVADDGRRNRFALRLAAPKLAAMAAFTSAAPAKATHVLYRDLVEDPVGTIGAVLTAAGVRPCDLGGPIERFLAAQRSGARAAPPAELDAMGYTPEDVWAEPSVSAYCRRFGIVPERTRLTGAAAPR